MTSIVVTGHSRGLGAAITRELLESTDHQVIGISRSDPPAELDNSFPERLIDLTYDLSEPEYIGDFYKETLKEYGPIVGLVNNAALGYDDLVTNASFGHLSDCFSVNVESPILLSKYIIRDMLLHRSSGSLVHVSSVSTSTGYSGLSMYAATKAALEGFSLSVAREWGERGIRSNCVAPGFMHTAMTDELSQSDRDRIYARTSLGEETSKASVASTVKFLLSEEANSITGEVVRVDSGTL